MPEAWRGWCSERVVESFRARDAERFQTELSEAGLLERCRFICRWVDSEGGQLITRIPSPRDRWGVALTAALAAGRYTEQSASVVRTLLTPLLCIALAFTACRTEDRDRSSPSPSRSTEEATATKSPDVYSAEIAVKEGPGYVTVGSGSVWVGNHPGQSVSRIDPTTNMTDQTIEIDGEPTGMLHAFGDVWTFAALTGKLHRIAGDTGEVIARITLEGDGGSINGLAEGAGSIWVSENSGNIYRVDPEADRVTSTIPVLGDGCGPGGNITFGADSVWYTCWEDNLLWEVDAASGEVVKKITVGEMAGSPQFADRSVWLPLMAEGIVIRVDAATGQEIERVRVGAQVEQFRISGDDMWVRVNDQELARVDLKTGQVVETYELPAAPIPGGGLAIGFGSVWVANFGEATIWRIEP
jgi:streptogramin lyase